MQLIHSLLHEKTRFYQLQKITDKKNLYQKNFFFILGKKKMGGEGGAENTNMKIS